MEVHFSNLKSQRNAACNRFQEERHKTNHTFCGSRISGNMHSPRAATESHVKCTPEASTQTPQVWHWLCPHKQRFALRRHRCTGRSEHRHTPTCTHQAPVQVPVTGSAEWNDTPNCIRDRQSTQAQSGVHCRQEPGRTLNN